jgi:NAD-dependent dihydropyrimidine dehydrogenase PreA subunit
MDVCLMFNPEFAAASEARTATKTEALQILDHAGEKRLVARPFRKPDNPNILDGICFCCPGCCYYFKPGGEPCDKGNKVQSTDLDTCTACGLCIDLPYI